ncbi:MAG: radical SAM protein [Candidatus Odinarchaeia archaeon]
MNTSKIRRLILSVAGDRCEVPLYDASAGGRRVTLFKTLLANKCRNACKYCGLRCNSRSVEWDTEKLVNVVKYLAERRQIEGLFLTSTIKSDPDEIVEKEIHIAEEIKSDPKFETFYIHLRLMPGTSRYLIRRAALIADRIGINLEAPTKTIFQDICPDKDYLEDIITQLKWCSSEWRNRKENLSAGVDTQLIVGAVEDSDIEYLKTVEWAYNNLKLRRVYFSRFTPIKGTPLENNKPAPLWREFRLYQASFLIRDYGFKVRDLQDILDDSGYLPNVNPKLRYASLHPEMFPIDLNTAKVEEILKIPYIGPRTCRKILKLREEKMISHIGDLVKIVGRYKAKIIAKYVELKGSPKNLTLTTWM